MEDSPRLMSIGGMSKLYGVSHKALHVYQEKGILEPNYVNEQTGYRYYTADQGSILDAISQLQTAGFSLEEIKTCIKSGSVAFLEEKLQRAEQLLEAQERELAIARSRGNGLLKACDLLISKPACGEIMIERLPDRKALTFDIPPVRPDDKNNQAWDSAIRAVRTQLIERYGNTSLFESPSGIITQNELEKGTLTTFQACIFIDDELATFLGDAVVIPGGQHLTMYFDSSLLDNGSSIEYPSLRQMLRYAEEHSLAVNGDYIGETIANTPAFAYQNRDAFFKMCLPVTRADGRDRHETAGDGR